MAEPKPQGSKVRAGLAASLLLHLAFVAAVILSLPRLAPPPEPRGFEVSLVPLQHSTEPRRPRSPASRPAAQAAAAPAAPRVALPASPVAQVPAASGDPDGPAKVTGMLRGSVGCAEASFAHLTQQELDRCARWRQAQVKPGLEILAPIEANKRAWFDATVAARNAPDHVPVGGCFGKPPPHAIKLGPCYIEPPKGPFSEDVDVPPEPSR